MVTDKTDKVLFNLPTFMRRDVNSRNYKFVTSFQGELDDVQTQIGNLKSSIQISTAIGSNLDDIGDIFLLPRRGSETDTNYRARILAFWPGYSGGGTEKSIKQAIARMTDLLESDITVTESPYADLKFKVTATLNGFTADIPTIQEVVAHSKAAGTYAILDLATSLTEEYVSYTDNVDIALQLYIVPDVYQVEGTEVLL